MREYEMTYILSCELTEEEIKEIKEKVEQQIKQQQGEVLLHDHWSRRKLVYRINHKWHGDYFYIRYLANAGVEHSLVVDLERTLKYDDRVLRYMTVLVADKIDDLEKRKAEPTEMPGPIPEYAAERKEYPKRSRA